MDDIFYAHPEPIWMQDLIFALHVPIPGKSGEYEQLITEELGDSEFKVLCIPFFIYGVSLGDVINIDIDTPKESRKLVILKRSGRCVFRVWFDRYEKKNVDVFLNEVKLLGGLHEQSSKRMYAIDAADDATAGNIRDYLEKGESEGRWIFEDGE